MLRSAVIGLALSPAVGATAQFTLPEKFVGLWNGSPDFTVIGPFIPSSYTFSISQSPMGDYLLENNIIYDNGNVGYQRFYVEGYGDTAGNLWYCGTIQHYFDGDGVTGDGRLNGFKSVALTESSVTFCLDTDNPDVMTGFNNPFQSGCKTCDCANWTMTYDSSRDTLLSQLSMAGSEGHTHSKHLWTEMQRAGAAPVIDDADLPGHGSEFSCDFEEGGRDSVPVSDQVPGARVGCPFLTQRQLRGDDAAKPAASRVASDYTHCYVLNQQTDYRLEWTLDEQNEALHCRVSAPATSENTYVAIGFRPASRVIDPHYINYGTGHHMDFGMEGADIVVGSGGKGLRSLYAELYTGPPVADRSLQLSDASAEYSEADGRIALSFTRPLVGGFLQTHYGVNASIVSYNADIIWAIGADESSTDDPNGSTCSYHDNTRGMRFVDWADPTIAMYDLWKCS